MAGAPWAPPPGWTTTGNLTVWAQGGDVAKTVSAEIHGGARFFSGGSGQVSTARQRIDVSQAASEIDAGTVQATLAGDLGGFEDQDDSAAVAAVFQSASGAKLGAITIGPVLAADRKNRTGLLPRSSKGTVPKGTRAITVVMAMKRTAGADNDGYADNLDLELTTAKKPTLVVRCVGKQAVARVRPLTKDLSVAFRFPRNPGKHAVVKAIVTRASGGHFVLTKRLPC